MKQNQPSPWLAAFPALRTISDPAWRAGLQRVQVATIPQGTILFQDGDPCRSFVMVARGIIRVQKLAPNGREIVLYRVASGETCILTTTCLLGDKDYPAEGIAETDVRAAVMPSAAFQEALSSEGFRNFVFNTISARISDLMALVEEVAFRRMDVRLARLLLNLSGQNGLTIEYTHQKLAVELGTAREVVSRLLKEFERKAWVRLERGRVRVIDRHGMERLTGE